MAVAVAELIGSYDDGSFSEQEFFRSVEFADRLSRGTDKQRLVAAIILDTLVDELNGTEGDHEGRPLEVAISDGTTGELSAEGWESCQVVLPPFLAGVCEKVEVLPDGPHITVSNPLFSGMRDEVDPEQLTLTVPVFNKDGRPAISLSL